MPGRGRKPSKENATEGEELERKRDHSSRSSRASRASRSSRASRIRVRKRGSGLSSATADPDIRNTVDMGTSVENDTRESLAANESLPYPPPDEEEEEEEEEDEEYQEEEEEEEEVEANPLQVAGVGRPFVWVRIKPTRTFDHDLFRIGEDEKKLQIIVEPEERLQKRRSPASVFTFNSDGILRTPNQEEIFQSTIQELVEKAMIGVSGAVLCMGTELSGKNYTLFGPLGKYEDRGLLPRSLELIFDTIESRRNDFEYHIILSMFDIHKNKMKDLITLGPYELGRVGDFGPKGLFYEEITSTEQALVLILRGLMGQELMHQQEDSCSKFHTIVYVDILAKELRKRDASDPLPAQNSTNCEELNEWRSRITFAKIASIPVRDKVPLPPKCPPDHFVSGGARGGFCYTNWACPGPFCFDDYGKVPPQPAGSSNSRSRSKSASRSCNGNCTPKCCRGPTGELGEGINIRKEMYFLEQMFRRAHELRKIHDYYNKLQTLGMYMLMPPPKLAPSQYFRQSKLTHCLKDIVSGTTMVRLILHVRPERKYIQTTLEAIRFASRARCIPPVGKKNTYSKGYGDCLTIEEKISNMCQEMGIQDPVQAAKGQEVEEGGDVNADTDTAVSPEKLKEVLAQATAFFEDKLDSLEGDCKNQVKSLFETFRETLLHVFDKDRELSENGLSGEEELEDTDQDLRDDASEAASDSGSSRHRKDKDGKPLVGKPSRGGKKKRKVSSRKDLANKDVQDPDSAGNEEVEDGTPNGEDDEEHPEDEDEDETHDQAVGSEKKSSFDAKTEAHQFQELCWNEFKESEKGSQLIEEFEQKQENLKKVLGDHDEGQKELAVGMGKLTELELQLDILEQDRFKDLSLDEHGVPIPSPDELQVRHEIQAVFKAEHELMTKLKETRVEIQEGKCHLDFQKAEVERGFQEFCMETQGKHAELANLPLSTLEHAVTTTLRRWSRIHRIKSPRRSDPLEDSSNQGAMTGASEKQIAFEILKRNARQQAISLLKAYTKRPPWISYY